MTADAWVYVMANIKTTPEEKARAQYLRYVKKDSAGDASTYQRAAAFDLSREAYQAWASVVRGKSRGLEGKVEELWREAITGKPLAGCGWKPEKVEALNLVAGALSPLGAAMLANPDQSERGPRRAATSAPCFSAVLTVQQRQGTRHLERPARLASCRSPIFHKEVAHD
jgi:hypothetical protein